MANQKLSIILELDNKGAVKGFKGIDGAMQSFDKASQKAQSGFSGMWKQMVAGQSAFALVQKGISTLKNLFVDTTEAFFRQEDAIAQLEAGLKSTGNQVGFTSEELQQMAASLQKVTTFGDEAIIEAQSMLLTFTKIGKDTFPGVTKAVLNLSARMGTDLKSSVVQLGKAFNDPVQNLSALSRSGIQFTKEQKNMIKTLWESGQTVKAQTIILEELETQFGGAAEAAAKTAKGGLTQFKNMMGDIGEEIGSVFAKILITGIDILQNYGKEIAAIGIAIAGVFAVTKAAAIQTAFVGAFTAIKTAMLSINPIITAVGVAIAGVTLGIKALLIQSEKAKKEIIDAANEQGKVFAKWRKQTEFEQKIRSEMAKVAIKNINMQIASGKKIEDIDKAKIDLTEKLFQLRLKNLTDEEKKQLTLEKSMQMSNEKVKESVVLTKEQKKAYEDLNRQMGILTDTSYKELQKESNSINVIWKHNKGMILGNEELTEKWRKKIDELIETFEKGKKPIPEFLKNINRELGFSLPVIDRNTKKYKELMPSIDDFGKKAQEAAKNQNAWNNENIKSTFNLEKYKSKVENTTNSIKILIGGIQDLGLFGSKTANNLMEAVDGVGDIFTNLKKPISDTFTELDKFKAVAGGVATAIGGLFGASDKTKQALKDIGSGIANIVKGDLLQKIAGGFQVLTGVLKLFSGDGVGEAIKRENAWMDITDQQTEALRELEKQLGSTHAATSTMLDELVDGQVTLQNSDKWLHRIRETLSDVDQGTISAAESVDLMGESFSKWLEQAKELGTTGSREFFNFVSDLRTRGLEVTEINDFIIDSLKTGFEGYKKYLEGDFSNATIGVFQDMLAWENKVSENKALIEGIRGLETALFGLSDSMQLNEEQFDQFEQAVRDGYDTMISKGFTANEAFTTIAPTLQRLQFLQEEFGLTIDDGTQKLIDQAKAQGLLKPDPINRMADAMERFIELLTDKMGLATKTARDGIDAIGNSIRGLGKKIKDVDFSGFNVSGSKIPKFATGTKGMFVKKPTLFIAGEKEPETIEFSGDRMRVTPISQSTDNRKNITVKLDFNNTFVIDNSNTGMNESELKLKLTKIIEESIRNGTKDLNKRIDERIDLKTA